MVSHWHRLPREVVESPCLEVFENHGGLACGDMVNGHCGVGLVLDLVILVVFSSLKWLLRAVSASSVDGPWEACAGGQPAHGRGGAGGLWGPV